ncbi:MAG TPA: phytanoyl-CoA dioxygenase family protein [Burkholderiales bacterium]|nr:phytanoyl-CoA dioxygenase family protein [Burkholderiales bacterium]
METTSANASTREPKVLTRAQVEAFAGNGYHFPVRAMGAEQALGYRVKLEGLERQLGQSVMKTNLRNKPHLALAWADELIRHPNILDAVEDILGPNLLCWSSSMFIKDARDPSYISWHQDSTYWGLSHPDVVTAWLALSPSTRANGCMRVDPGTHLMDQLPHKDTFAENNLLTRGQEVQVEVDERRVVDIELQPGEFSLHHVRLVHGSDANNSDERRIGFAIRYVPTYLKQIAGPRDSAMLVRGVDNYHHFDMEPRPKADMDPEAVEVHRSVTEAAAKILYRGTDKAPK